MQLKKIEGIVIGETNYSESSKILNIYTKEHGIISAISKGCRRIKSTLRSVSTKLTYGEFILNYKEGSISTLTGVDVLDSFINIHNDITLTSYAMYILELSAGVAKQNNDKSIFDLLIICLKKINEGLNPKAITLILETQYLKYLGIDLSIDGCSICGNTNDIVTIDVDKGGYICKDCYTNEILADQKTIKLIRMFYYVDINKISKVDVSDKCLKELDKFLEDYYDKYSGIYLKSKKFLNLILK